MPGRVVERSVKGRAGSMEKRRALLVGNSENVDKALGDVERRSQLACFNLADRFGGTPNQSGKLILRLVKGFTTLFDPLSKRRCVLHTSLHCAPSRQLFALSPMWMPLSDL